MANKLYDESAVSAIATAIRGKNGLTTQYKIADMAAAITAIPSGATYYSADRYGLIYTEDFILPHRASPNTISMISDAYNSATMMKSLFVGRNYNMGSGPFNSCTNLIQAKIYSCASTEMFWNCSSLKYCTIYSDVGSIKRWCFDKCGELVAVILPDNVVTPLDDSSAFSTSSCKVGGSGRIYVPSALVESYKAATNWVTFANNILPIESNMEIVGDYL